jgi:predicted membrane-bound spermidine synthase
MASSGATEERQAAARPRAPALACIGAAFFLSGAAALVYQVAWQRILALLSGVGIYSVAMIVAAFMAGLGLGSHWGGVLSTRVGPGAALRVFAALELGVGLFGAVSGALYYDVLYPLAPSLSAAPWRAGLTHFLALLLPTALMGMSLPFLARGLVRDVEQASRTLGLLYGINVLGASLGALLTPWVLMRLLGVRGALISAAGANVAAGLLALAAAWLSPSEDGASQDRAVVTRVADTGGEIVSFRMWLAVYTLSGFCALSLEILWFRIVHVAVKATAFTFGTVLCLYLLGYGAGSLLGARWSGALRRPLRAFLACQCLLLSYAGLAALALAVLPVGTPLYAGYVDYWRDGNTFLPGTDVGTLLYLYVVFPLLLYGPPTLLMGLAFPILQRAVHDDPRTSGLKVGLLQAANIAGCVAGSLLAGLVSLSWLGTMGTLRALLAVGLVFAALGAMRGARRLFAGLAAVLAGLALLLPSNEAFWRRLHGVTAERALLDEDASSVSALTSRTAGRWRVWVDGHSHSVLPFGGVHTQLGALPVLVHPQPRQVAVIGLGSGNTAWASGCRSETERLHVFEIAATQPRLLRRVADVESEQANLAQLLSDPRLQLRIADGRNALLAMPTRYDVIEIDALWAYYAGAGNLYSFEFFRLAAQRLKPGGLMCSWSPTPRVRDTFQRAFPYVLASRQVLIGSNEPIPRDVQRWRARLARPEVTAYLGEKPASDVRLAFAALQLLGPAGDEGTPNLDLFPRDEFRLRSGPLL